MSGVVVVNQGTQTQVVTVQSVVGSGNSFSPPTGTGFVHITSSAMDPAAKLVFDADVSATAAIAVSKLAAGTNTFVLTTTGGVPVWAAPAVAGISALTGDVTATGPGSVAATVVRVNGATVPAAGSLVTGNAAYVSGASALTYSALNLGGGSGWVTGVLPTANQAAQTLGGALSGTTAAAVIAPGTAGQVYVSNATPLAAWTSLINYETTHGRFTSGGGGTDYLAVIGPLTGFETGNAGLWLLPNATAATSGNVTLYSDGSNVFVNNRVANSGTISLSSGGNAAYWSWSSSTGNCTAGSASFTTPAIVGHSSATALTVGTNKTSGILNFQSGAALTALSLQNPGGSASLVLAKTAGQRQTAFRSTGSNYTVDSSGSGDEQIWMTAACVITLPAPSGCIGRVLEIIVGYDPAAGGGTIARNGTENINNVASNVTLVTGDKFSVLQVRCDGTNWIIKGGLAI